MDELDRRDFLKTGGISLGVVVAFPNKILQKKASKCDIPVAFDPVEDILRNLKALDGVYQAFPVSQLEHMLQTATLARRGGESAQFVMAALCHDMGKSISVFNHETIAAEMIRPYVDDDIYNMIKYHGIFQGRFFWDKIGRDPDTYLKFKGESWFDLAMKFTGTYDNNAFNLNFDTDSLESFIPLIRQVVEKKL